MTGFGPALGRVTNGFALKAGRARLRTANDVVARARMRYVVIACLGLAGLSLLLPSVPSYDPWAWIIWGRETVGLELDTRGDVAWKPLPVLFTTAFSLTGEAAPYLWLVVARAGALLALVMAYRLATRIAGPVAGGLAALALLLARDWTRYMANGLCEPLLIALILWAVERHLDGRREQALLLGLGAGLIRPEVWPFLGLYALLVWVREPHRRVLVAGVLLALPALWIVPEWLGSGNPLAGSSRVLAVADGSDVQSSRFPVLYALGTGLDRPPPPVYLGALAAVVLAVRRSSVVVLALAGGALAWMLLVLAMTLAGYPGIGRFFDASGAVLCVLAGIGAVWTVRAMRAVPRPRAAAIVTLAVAATLPFLVLRTGALAQDVRNANERAELQDHLVKAIQRTGPRVLGCGAEPTIEAEQCRIVANKSFLTALAWELDAHIAEVRSQSAPPALVFFTPASFVAGNPPELHSEPNRRRPEQVRRLTRAGDWTVYSDGRVDRGPAAKGGRSRGTGL